MIRNIIFDMGQVLLHWQPDMFVGAFDLAPDDRALLKHEMFEQPEWFQMDEGSITIDEGIDRICARLPERLHPCVHAITKGWWNLCFQPMEGMGKLISELKGLGYSIWLLSNAAVTLRDYFFRIPGSELFDGIYVSAEHKLLKPDPRIYRSFLDTFGLKGEECLFIDDRLENIEGAACENIRGIVFSGDTRSLRRDLESMQLLSKTTSGKEGKAEFLT